MNEETEILTNHGWKSYKTFDATRDQVVTADDDGALTLVSADSITYFDQKCAVINLYSCVTCNAHDLALDSDTDLIRSGPMLNRQVNYGINISDLTKRLKSPKRSLYITMYEEDGFAPWMYQLSSLQCKLFLNALAPANMFKTKSVLLRDCIQRLCVYADLLTTVSEHTGEYIIEIAKDCEFNLSEMQYSGIIWRPNISTQHLYIRNLSHALWIQI
jgi:hypothetical protein